MSSSSWNPERAWPRRGWSALGWFLALVVGGAELFGGLALAHSCLRHLTGLNAIGDGLIVFLTFFLSVVTLLIMTSDAVVVVHRLSSADGGGAGPTEGLHPFSTDERRHFEAIGRALNASRWC